MLYIFLREALEKVLKNRDKNKKTASKEYICSIQEKILFFLLIDS